MSKLVWNNSTRRWQLPKKVLRGPPTEWKTLDEVRAMCAVCHFTGRKLQLWRENYDGSSEWMEPQLDVSNAGAVTGGGYYRIKPLEVPVRGVPE